MRPASLRTLRWCETVAGVTPRRETISPQLMRGEAEMASKIRRRVSSARAFDIFSTSEWSMLEWITIDLECIEVRCRAAIGQIRNERKPASEHFDSHLNV